VRIAVVAHSFPRYSGDSHGPFVERLSQELAALGHRVDVLLPHHPELRTEGREPLEVSEFRYIWPSAAHLLGYSRTLKRDTALAIGSILEAPLYFAFGARALSRLVRRRSIELVHAHWILPNGFLAARARARTGVPYAVTLHGSDVFMAERNPLFRALARTALAGATYVTSCSADLRERLLALAGPQHAAKIHLVANGTDLVAPPSAEALGAARRRLGLAADERAVVSVGRMVDKKGFDVLVAAWPRVVAAAPRARLVLGGGGPLREALERQAQALGVADRVRFAGALSHPEVLELVALGEIFAMPSVRDAKGNIDGLPVVVLEAMAAAKPVVASEIAGIPLVVTPELTGLLVPERDPEALAAALLRLLADPVTAARWGRAGRERVERDLTWAAIARRHDRLRREALGR